VYGSWGRFTQAQRVDEWRAEEAQTAPDRSELAVHSILGIVLEPSAATRATLEVYRKRWTAVSPYFDNAFNGLSLVPDLQPDRVRVTPGDSESSGLELSVRHALGPALEIWGSYAWSRVADELPDGDVLRGWDQPHALTLGLGWADGRWNASALVGWHRGWPRTDLNFTPATATAPVQLVVGPRNADRWSNYLTLDARVSWTLPLERSELSLAVDITNGTDRRNACCERFISSDDTGTGFDTQRYSWLPRTVNVGISWRFHERRE
jgi:hypothetical protein